MARIQERNSHSRTPDAQPVRSKVRAANRLAGPAGAGGLSACEIPLETLLDLSQGHPSGGLEALAVLLGPDLAVILGAKLPSPE